MSLNEVSVSLGFDAFEVLYFSKFHFPSLDMFSELCQCKSRAQDQGVEMKMGREMILPTLFCPVLLFFFSVVQIGRQGLVGGFATDSQNLLQLMSLFIEQDFDDLVGLKSVQVDKILQ